MKDNKMANVKCNKNNTSANKDNTKIDEVICM